MGYFLFFIFWELVKWK